jgi:hypothetical protein
MRKRLEVWMWAIPVLLASLVFWPVWLFAIVSGAVRVLSGDSTVEPKPNEETARNAAVSIQGFSERFGQRLVISIASWKYHLLTGATLAAGALALALAIFLIAGEGEKLTSAVGEIEGFVAIAGLVLGLPALAYAMVTDSTVGRIKDQLGADRRREIEARLGERLRRFEEDLPDHCVQVFLPDLQQARLLPIYDPERDGPVEGWAIDRRTPQALTGSAWVGRSYLQGASDKLKQAKLRLTPVQAREYADLKAVAAAPIFGKGHLDPLGVLTVYSRSDNHTIGTDAFEHKHKEAAKGLAWIIDDYIPESGPLSQHDLSSGPRP